ncbi:MAG TPA: BamA/TamA family outer membrane protein [Salinimicrobium sp.]|nr:BamA/TamA family outer membrane protein [Salinimicrobium sp.]
MNSRIAKISLFLVIFICLLSCNALKRVDSDELLLIENNIYNDSVEVKDKQIENLLYQQPNSRLLGIPFKLHIYNLAKPNPDSTFQAWINKKPKRKQRWNKLLSEKQVLALNRSYVEFNEFLKNAGEAPAIIDKERIQKSVNRLKSYYWNNGWFNVEAEYKIDSLESRKAVVDYFVKTHKPYIVDSIKTRIDSPVADSIYRLHAADSRIQSGVQYKTSDFNAERDRLTEIFRNSGLYHFEQDYLTFEADTINTDHKTNATVIIRNRPVTSGDSTKRVPFYVHNINRVNVVSNFDYENRNQPLTDSAFYEGYYIYSYGPLEYKPSAISDAVFIKPGGVFKDSLRVLTYNRINQLRHFKYPNIEYIPDPDDSLHPGLIANIFLTPLPKIGLNFDVDVSQNNIQDIGISFGGVFSIRNVFKGAETLEISGRTTIGSSKDAADSEDKFFNISEVGADVKLTFPRLFLPFNSDQIIPKTMFPFTSLSAGVSAQNNIGLDRQNITGILNYRWFPSEEITHRFDLLDIQYVRNLNTNNYFNVYRNSYSELNEIAQSSNVSTNSDYFNEAGNLTIPEGANSFISDVVAGNGATTGLNQQQRNEVNNIRERKNRLSENNLIFGSSFTYIHNTKEDIYDEDFQRLRVKLESAGNFLSGISKLANLEQDSEGRYRVMGVNFSQYIKTEIDYIKHWDLGRQNIIATRAFGGIAIPYGNANSIPFSRSFFAGGPNDNRAWQPYELGPGSSGGLNEFNEANFKLAFNAEYRFQLIGDLHSAFFVDVGNIWNALDVVEDEASTFTSLSDLKDIAVGSGFGLRYDLDFFVIRVDVGFKTYDPAKPEGSRWFNDYNFPHAVYNFGINYPF